MTVVPKLFWVSGSPYSWRVLLALEVKRIGYESLLLHTERGDLEDAHFRQLSPRGCVPTLEHGGFALCESLAILVYLDREFPDVPIFGSSARDTGAICGQIFEFTDYLEPHSKGIVKAIYAGRTEVDRAEIAEHSRAVRQELVRIEKVIGTGPWFMGDWLSAADIAIYPFLKSLFRAAAKPEAQPLDLQLLSRENHYPAIDRWMKRMEGLPGYERFRVVIKP